MQVCAAVTFSINIVQHLTSYCDFFPEEDPPCHNALVLPQFAVRTPFNPIFFTVSMDVKIRIFLSFFWVLSPLSHLCFSHLFVLQRYTKCFRVQMHSS